MSDIIIIGVGFLIVFGLHIYGVRQIKYGIVRKSTIVINGICCAFLLYELIENIIKYIW